MVFLFALAFSLAAATATMTVVPAAAATTVATSTKAIPAKEGEKGSAGGSSNNSNSSGGERGAHAWIFITKRGCTPEEAMQLRQGLLLNKFGYAPYTDTSFDVVCFPKARLLTVDQTVDGLRSAYPSDAFIFVYNLSSSPSPAPPAKKVAPADRGIS
ncbi:MAG: hypothetical protein C4292_05545 [Nitrososphaera sp.]